MIGKLQHKLMALETVKRESNNWKIVSSFEKFDDLIQRHVEKIVDFEHKSPSKRKRRKVTRFGVVEEEPSVTDECPTIKSIKRGLSNRERGEDRKNIRADVEKLKRMIDEKAKKQSILVSCSNRNACH